MKARDTSWDSADRWYDTLVGEKGHYYHESVIFPSLFKLLGINSKSSGTLLDVGCGNGVLARQLPRGIQYTGVDASKKLIEAARAKTPTARFVIADATDALPLAEQSFDWVVFVLSLQNMADGEQAVRLAAERLKTDGRMAIVLNHPCFRIPRQTSWGIDEPTQLQQRRINRYYSPLEIPIQIRGETTLTFHHPLSTYFAWTSKAKCVVLDVEEWRSDKKSEGKMRKREDFARDEFPLFLTILARKEH